MNLELTVWDLKVIGTQLKVSYSSMNNVRSIITKSQHTHNQEKPDTSH